MAADLIKIPVSKSKKAKFFFVVHRIDNKLHLYRGSTEIFDAIKGEPLPKEHPLEKGKTYTLLYENNDGGEGFLKFEICEVSSKGQRTVKEIIDRRFDRSTVWDYRFSLA